MKDYKKILLSNLLDKYEKSQGYKDKANRKIYFYFNEKTIGDYYDEYDSLKKKEIDILCNQLQSDELIKIHWGKGYNSHNILKIELNGKNVKKIYEILNRREKKYKERKVIELLKQYNSKGECIKEFSNFVFERIENNKPIKEYLDIDNLNECKDIIKGVEEVLNQKEEIFRRNFSIRVYGDSKRFESIEGKILKIIKRFSDKWSIEEYNILKNYSYVYFKGDIDIKIKQSNINVLDFKGGIAFSSKDIDEIEKIKVKSNSLVTIENLTSFNNYSEKNATVYLGGYHNSVRQKLLLKIYKNNKEISYYHCGDIDVGGFKILNYLIRKTGIPFMHLNMDKETISNNIMYAKDLTINDKREIEKMIKDDSYMEYFDVLKFMLESNKKLEQEIIF